MKTQEQDTIDSRYTIIEKKGFGATANVFLVKQNNDDNNVYAAKVLKEHSDLFDNEIEMLNNLRVQGNLNPYITNIIGSGEGLIIRKNHPQKVSQYLVLEYASKGELFNYIYFTKCGLSELHSKVIFAKILRGIQACHNLGICHRDLKMQNILMDEKFNPKICDFGFATRNDHPLTEYLGTRNYAAPEILRNKPYDGIKVDIFSLGVVLLTLTTCKIGFLEATRNDPYYRLIMVKHYEQYWNTISNQITGISQELKNLFIKMVAFKPNDRPSIDEILNDEWMREIRDMTQTQLEQLESEIRTEFLSREEVVNNNLKQELEVENQSSELFSETRGAEDGEKYFDLNLKPKYAQTGLNMNNYIKIKGTMNNPCRFMNSLCNKLKDEFKGECLIETAKDKLKFIIIFPEQENEEEDIPDDIKKELEKLGIEEDEDVNDDGIKGKNTIIQIKLFESEKGGYLLRYVRKEGNEREFLDKLSKISSVVKTIV